VLRLTGVLRKRRWLLAALLVGAIGALAPARARAHFILIAPDSWMSQDAFGLPEKVGPCGNEGGGTPTGKLTTFRPGQTITITINEVIPHPGHYRVALAVNDRSEFPPEPVVTPTAGDPCGNVAIQDPPIFPILADNMLPHAQAFTRAQSFTVTLPTDVTCTKCTLQVLEYMSQHGQPCFYHHCADISIAAEAATATPTPTPTPTDTQPATEVPTPSIVPTPTATFPPCLGDCDHSHTVSVDELVVGVRIALGELSPAWCPALDGENAAAVTVDELVVAVNNALNGCAQ